MKKEDIKPSAKFTKGQIVYNNLTEQDGVISDYPTWNGLTWMYSFKGDDMRCGENYLSAYKTKKDHTEDKDPGYTSEVMNEEYLKLKRDNENIKRNVAMLRDALKFLLSSYRADFNTITGGDLNDTQAVLQAKYALEQTKK